MTPVSLHDISKQYGSTPVLERVSIDIEPGELFFLLGPSGCGKSTLLRIVAGFLEPNAGTVRFGQDDVTRLRPEKRNAGMVFQSYALWPHMTVFGNVAFGLEIRKVPADERERRVMAALDMVGLGTLRDRPIPQLSGGQQQRVALARALVIRPRVLLLDEPLSNLDAKLRLDMRAEIRRICKESGLTTIYVTHDQKEALSMADRLAILVDGCLAQVGTPRDIYRRPNTRFVADFIGESNFVPGRVVNRTDHACLVETAWGNLASQALTPGVKTGDPCLVCIRPESLRFTDDTPGENRLSMRIVDTVYLGELGQWTLGIGDDRIKMFELRPVPRDPGQTVTCRVEPDDVIVLPASE